MIINKSFILFVLYILAICIPDAGAQSTDSTTNFGIWQSAGEKINIVYPEMNGRLCNLNWKDFEILPNVWIWEEFDSTFTAMAKDNLPFIALIYTKQDAPDWLYTKGVPKVEEKDVYGNVAGYGPYFADYDYKVYYKRMISKVRQHIEEMPDSVRHKVLGVQACMGSTGDYIGYKGTVLPEYDLSAGELFELFKEFSTYYYNEYIATDPKIYVLSNPSNDGDEEILWLLENCPDSWIKTGSIGKGFQLNDEKSKYNWLYNILNKPQNGIYTRSRSEITGGATSNGWWQKSPYKNMFALMCYGVSWGLDMSNQGVGELTNSNYDPSFSFFNKYAISGSQKDPLKSTNAMCALKDVLDAADITRFPVAAYGNADRSNIQRYQAIAAGYSAFGARLEDINVVSSPELENLTATGINDVGWDLLPGNYDRFLHQITPNETSIGYWNVASADTASIYGRFARGFDIAANKKGLYFNVEDSFLGNTPLNGKYPVVIDITYLDRGTGSVKLYYDSKSNGPNKQSIQITCANSNTWKKATVTLFDAYFGNRGTNGADFYIKSANDENVIFSIVELSRPKENLSDVGLHIYQPPAFDTICLNGTSQVKPFSITGSFLTGSVITIGPLNGYKFAAQADGVYGDTYIISNYGTSVNTTVYMQLVSSAAGTFPGNLSIRGGGYPNIVLPFTGGTVTDSRPLLSANVNTVTCNKYNNGSIDLVTTGGAGPFSYSWSSSSSVNFSSLTEDIAALKPAEYSVTVTSRFACTTTGSYTITEPDFFDITFMQDSNIVCKNGSTTITIGGTGGTLPYSGTGVFPVNSGSRSYTIYDAKGCERTKSFFVPDGILTAPSKPSAIKPVLIASTGLCGGGDFGYYVNDVANATYYNWGLPAGCSLVPPNVNSPGIILRVPSNFSGGTLTVNASNTCGTSSTSSKTLKLEPDKPDSVSGPKTVLRNQTGLIYKVSPVVPGVTYSWSVNAGAKITAGQSTSSITVLWGILNGKVTVKATNNCTNSAGVSVNVNILGLLTDETGLVNNDYNDESADEEPASAAPPLRQETQYLQVMPNPVQDVAHVIFSAGTAHKFSLELTDVTGRLLVRNTGIAQKGENRLNIDLHNYANGLYLLMLTNEKGKRKTIKILKGK